jgi:GAF domain-containing protein
VKDHDRPAPSAATESPDSANELARHLADIANVMLSPGGATTTVERILTLAAATMDSCDEVALCGDSASGTPPVGSALMCELDALQSRVGEGPCLDTLGGSEAVYVPDLLDDRSWPVFSAEAVRCGFRSTLAYRLSFEGQTLGSLQLYAQLPVAFNADERAQGLIFASYAGLALALAKVQAEEEDRIGNLESALSSREVIGQRRAS